MDPAKNKEIKVQDDLMAFYSGPQILIEPGIIPRGEFIPTADIINEPAIATGNIQEIDHE